MIAASTPNARYSAPPPKSPIRLSGIDRRLAAATHRVDRAGECDVVEVVPRGLRERPGLAPSGHAPVDQTRVAFEAYVGPKAEALHHTGPEAFDQRVGLRDQLQHEPESLQAS